MKTRNITCIHGRPSSERDEQWPVGFDLPSPCESPLCRFKDRVYEFAHVLARVYWATGFTHFRILRDDTGDGRELRFLTRFAGINSTQAISFETILGAWEHRYALAGDLAVTARKSFIQQYWKEGFSSGGLPAEDLKERVENLVASAFTASVDTLLAMAKKLSEVEQRGRMFKLEAENLRAELAALRSQQKPSSN